jgi:hypothetical protein
MAISDCYIAQPSAKFAATQDRPSTEFEKVRDEQSASLVVLSDLVSTLADRLAPVLVPATILRGEADSGSDSVEAVPAQLIATMRTHTHRIQDASDRISALLNRLCI